MNLRKGKLVPAGLGTILAAMVCVASFAEELRDAQAHPERCENLQVPAFPAAGETASVPNEDKAYGELCDRIVERIRRWPGLAPHETAADPGRYAFDEKNKVWRRHDVSCPEVVVLRPERPARNTLVVVMSGGGYSPSTWGTSAAMQGRFSIPVAGLRYSTTAFRAARGGTSTMRRERTPRGRYACSGPAP